MTWISSFWEIVISFHGHNTCYPACTILCWLWIVRQLLQTRSNFMTFSLCGKLNFFAKYGLHYSRCTLKRATYVLVRWCRGCRGITCTDILLPVTRKAHGNWEQFQNDMEVSGLEYSVALRQVCLFIRQGRLPLSLICFLLLTWGTWGTHTWWAIGYRLDLRAVCVVHSWEYQTLLA